MKNLQKLRQDAGLSQQALAEHFHLSQQTIHKYESGLAQPDIAMLIQLAQFFNVSVDYLIANDTQLLSERADYVASYTVEEIEIVRCLRNIKSGMRSALFEYIKSIS